MGQHINSYTFYSYKGGSGRSTTAVNTVRHLADVLNASPERPILLVDADLESAGLSYFFKAGENNPFTDLFNDTLHTTKLILKPDLYFDRGPIESRLFGNKIAVLAAADNDSLVRRLATMFTALCHDRDPKAYTPESVKAMLTGVMLTQAEIGILLEYCISYEKTKANPQSDDFDSETDKKRMEKYGFSLTALGQKLKKIYDSSSLSDTQKAKETEATIKGVLPATSFLDISSHFGKESGTVRFLGVDVEYEGAQIVRGENTTRAIRTLINRCKKNNFCAIIFDSGAGVQSTADAFHKVSDVLVYCMRPTSQFRSGTRNQLAVHRRLLESILKEKKENKKVADNYKPIILLPTAVPLYTENNGTLGALCAKRDEAIKEISTIAKDYSAFVDDTFCNMESVLNEVELFKWEERILLSEEQIGNVADQLRAFRVYGHLAKKLCELSRPAEENQA